jgi:VanZ family protein
LHRLLVFVVLLIVHGSLYPWHFQAPPRPADPNLFSLQSWTALAMNRYVVRDTAVNLVLYLPLGLFGFLALSRQTRRTHAAAATLVLTLLLSGGLELAQRFVPTRTSSLFDLVLNLAGAAVGLGLAVGFEDRLRTLASAGARTHAPGASGALVLLSCWAGYQLFPFFPDLSRTRVLEKLVLWTRLDAWSSWGALVSFAEWTAAGRLLASLIRPETTRTALLILLLLLPARMLLAGRNVMAAELAGAALAAALWQGSGSLDIARTRAVTWLLALALVVDGLAPFHFESAGEAFRWIPFQAALESDWQAGFAVLLHKSFTYGAAVWLLQRCGWRWVNAGALVSLGLAGIEVVQIHLPGRTAEVTDPGLALVMTWILASLEHRAALPVKIAGRL